MTIPIILVIVAFLALLLLAGVATGRVSSSRSLVNAPQQLRSVDVEAFRNLIDPVEIEFLRTRLSPPDFRKIQRQRLRAAVAYIFCASQNATVLLRLGETARQSPDPAIAAAAEKLVNNAIRLRLYAFQAIGRLYVAMILPGARVSAIRVADRYEQLTRQVIMLGLHYPTRGVSAAL